MEEDCDEGPGGEGGGGGVEFGLAGDVSDRHGGEVGVGLVLWNLVKRTPEVDVEASYRGARTDAK